MIPPARGIIFDGDDTLWSTERLYDQARSKARSVVERTGLDGAEWEKLERRIDVENVAIMGFSTERFPTSCVQAYDQLSLSHGMTPNITARERVRKASASVFLRTPPVMARARKTLKNLRARGTKLALLTKGDPELQKLRVEQSGLGDLFDLIEIVPEKSPRIIREVVQRMGLRTSDTWMVGNSMRSDILPAIEAGLHAVWIDAHVWEFERTRDAPTGYGFTTLPRLSDITALIAQ